MATRSNQAADQSRPARARAESASAIADTRAFHALGVRNGRRQDDARMTGHVTTLVGTDKPDRQLRRRAHGRIERSSFKPGIERAEIGDGQRAGGWKWT